MSAREVDFESVNVLEDDAGALRLRKSGLRALPVVSRDGEFVYGVDLAEVARLVGLSYEAVPVLGAPALTERLGKVLAAALRYAAQIPHERLGDKLPHRDRSYLTLINHLVQIPVDFLAVADGADLTGRLAASVPEVDLQIADLEGKVATTVNAMRTWLERLDIAELEREVDTYFGVQTLHQVLERCVWHAAQHTRQLMMVLELLNVEPDGPLGAVDFADLPMPEQVWDG